MSRHRPSKRVLLVSSLAALWATPALADQIVTINNGDSAALVAAFQQANQATGVTTIVLAQRGTYAMTGERLQVSGSVVLEGRGATMRPGVGATASSARIDVNPSGSATVREINFTGYLSAPLETSGRLSLESVSLHGNTPTGSGFPGSRAALIATGLDGHLSATNVTIAGNTTAGPQRFVGLVYNQGTSDLRHVTIAGNQRGSAATGSDGPFAIFNESGSANVVTISNSVIVNDAIPECAGTVTTRGGNVFGDASCGLPMDDLISSAGVVGPLDLSELVATVPLVQGSAAIDFGRPQFCVARDALGTTRLGVGGAAGCDAGAQERAQSPLTQDGMNGVYYGANNDGQYVSIQRLSASTALVVWYGFDGAGRNTWIFGVGDISGTRITTSAFQQTGGTLGSDGVVRGAQTTPFGSLVVNLASCDSGTLDYASDLSAFGTGRVPLRRLTVTHDTGCSG